MIEIQVGKIGRARIEGRVWTSDVNTLQAILTDLTAELFIHGGIPDADAFIVDQIKAKFPSVSIIASTEPAEDPEAIEPESKDHGTD